MDLRHGTYLPFRKIVEAEGLDAEGLAAARRYVEKCRKMSGPWCEWSSMTERWHYLYVRVEFRESFTKSWSLCEQQTEKVAEQHCEGMEAGTPVKEQGMKRPLPEVLPAKAKKTCGAVHDAGKSKKEDLGKGTPSKLGEAGKRTPKPRAPLELALQEATQTKQALMKAMSTGQNIVDAVTNDATWQWARGDQTVEKACGCHEAGDKLHDRLRQVLRKRRHPDSERGVPRKAVAARAECLPHGHAQPRAGRGP